MGVLGGSTESRRWGRTARKLLLGFLAVDVLLTAAYAAAILLGLSAKKGFALVDLNAEANPSAWWESAKLLIAAMMLFALGSRFFRDDERLGRVRALLITLGVGFTFLSLDEAGVVHERLSKIVQRIGFTASFRGGEYWLLPYLVVAAALAGLLAPQIVRFVRQWPGRTSLFASGVGLSVLGGVVLEGISYASFRGRYAHLATIGVEEFLEMAGFTLAVFAVSKLFFEAVGAVASRMEASGPAELETAEPPSLPVEGEAARESAAS